MESTAEGPCGCGVAARGTAEAQVNASRGERFERAELLGNDKRCMIRQHDAARAHADFRSCICDVTDQHGCRRACDAVNIMVFSQPKSLVAQGLRALRERARVAESFINRSALS